MKMRTNRLTGRFVLPIFILSGAPVFRARELQKQPRGMALVLVLGVLVLLTILVVGFLSRASVERTSASAYFEGNRNDLLADQAVNIVRTQIDYASTRSDTAWASQPGMVRTFRQDGTLLNAYKLYSDSDMITNTVDIAAAASALENWAPALAHFVDLNEPVEADGKKHYPILDPSALEKNGDSKSLIEGFDVTNAPGTSERQPIPMPVRWLYVLEDGQAVAPSNTSGSIAEIPEASKDNPIVGRIAFWTDDETCKLNINTASHGAFWDIPRAFTIEERDRMARFQPALREFQRYPGHPASTSLWPVLGYKVEKEEDFGNFAYQIAPRVQQGGSEGGKKFAGVQSVALDGDRLYASADEVLFSATNGKREMRVGLNRADIERTKFFLTARSNSPEVNLFNLPRMAIWPVNAGNKTPSTLDEVLAFCATINHKPYFFQRSDPNSATADMKLDSQADGKGRNEQLYSYINALLAKPFPGFGSRSFAEKYTAAETEQLTTNIFDYIRSSNLYSTALGATAYTGAGANPLGTPGSRAGQVTPIQIGDTKGFGRLPALSQAVFHLYVSGLQSAKGRFPSGAYPMQIGPAPLYSADFSTGSYKSVRDLLNATGTGKEVELLTSGILYFDAFDPMLGYTKPRYNFQVEVSFSGGWQVNGQPLGFGNATLNINRDQSSVYNSKTNAWNDTFIGRYLGGLLGPLWMMQNYGCVKGNPADGTLPEYPLAGQRLVLHQPVQLVNDNAGKTDGSGNPLPDKPTLPPNTQTADQVAFSGGTVTAKIKVDGKVVQSYEFVFPPFTKPAPTYAPRGYLGIHSGLVSTNTEADMVLKQFATSADFRHRWASLPFNNVKYMGTEITLGTNADYCDLWLIQDMDIVVALEPNNGDKRILAGRTNLTTGAFGDDDANFVPNKDYASSTARIAADYRNEASAGWDRRERALLHGTRPGRLLDITYGANAMPDIPNRYPHGVKETTDGKFWPDFDNGPLHISDDAYVNRADEGSANTSISDGLIGSATGNTGFSWYGDTSGSLNNAIFFSPNKQMPSAGMFGSLPTGVVRNKPWQTLLFRPDPGGEGKHPGAEAPEDFLLLDLFWMPVVEPYAISEPFSSNGKVNMNYQIMPFGYIHRSTALRGVLQKQEIVSIENSLAYKGNGDPVTGYGSTNKAAWDDNYKLVSYNDLATSLSSASIRRRLNLSESDGTLKPFEDLFAGNKIFRSETQICSIPLIPEDATWSSNFERDYWDSRRLTGDNSREMPYTQLLPRLTTRSNTYTVHFRVQSLKKRPSSDPAIWDETKDKMSAEYRGSRTIERYIDPNDTRIPDYANDPGATPSLDAFYRWRTLYNRTFAP